MFPQYTGGAKLVRAVALVAIFALSLMAGAACKRSGVEGNANSSNSSKASNDISRTPPFSTKEPERYQWTSVTTVSPGDQATPAQTQAVTRTSQVFIARDGELRREDYEPAPGIKLSFLQLRGAHYRLLHSKKLYAEFGDDESAGATPAQNGQHVPPDFSPDKLNAARAGARYEKLGAEEVNGRMTTKYGVRLIDEAGGAEVDGTKSFIWFDESLGVPVKTEANSASGARYTVELRDIKLEVDASLFALPVDYKRVDSEELDAQMLSTSQLGGDGDENDTKAQGK